MSILDLSLPVLVAIWLLRRRTAPVRLGHRHVMRPADQLRLRSDQIKGLIQFRQPANKESWLDKFLRAYVISYADRLDREAAELDTLGVYTLGVIIKDIKPDKE